MSIYTPYHKESALKAKELCKNTSDPAEKCIIISNYISKNFVYDYLRAIKVKQSKKTSVDINRTWATHLGICTDISALAFNMFKAVGLRCYVCVGYADGSSHAWVEVVVGKERLLYDHANKIGKKIKYVIKHMYQ